MTRTERAALLPVGAAGLITGLLVGGHWDLPAGAAFLLAVSGALLVVLSVSMRRAVVPALAVLAVVLGVARAATVETPGAGLEQYRDVGSLSVRGIVTTDPTGSGSVSSFDMTVDSVSTDLGATWAPERGDIRVSALPTAELAESRNSPLFRYGDRLELRGLLIEPEELGDFDYPGYLERRGIVFVMSFPDVDLISEGNGNVIRQALASARRAMAVAVGNTVAEPQAAFGQSILLGIRDDLPEALVDDFRKSGAAHLLAISGLHVGVLLVSVTSASAFLFGRRRQVYLLAPLIAVWVYVGLSGASPSAVRAAVMGTMYIAAIAVGRPGNLAPSLALAAAVMAVLEPRVLMSISFQLSFAAMMGIGVYLESINGWALRKLGIDGEAAGTVSESVRDAATLVGLTAAATLATAPLVGLHFGQIPTGGVVTTLLTLPALPPALGAHGATALVGLLSESAATPFAWLAWGISWYITSVVALAASIPAISLGSGSLGAGVVWAYYIVLAVGTLTITGYIPWRAWVTPRWEVVEVVKRRSPPWQATALAVVLAGLVWAVVLSRPGGTLRVVFADVGQGDMTVITTPAGQRIVVDGGPKSDRAVEILGEELPFWERALDLVVLTHPHSDHVTGLNEVLRRYDVGRVLERPQEFDSAEYVSWRKLTGMEDAQSIDVPAGAHLRFDDGVRVEVLGPPREMLSGTRSDVDNGSVVVRIVYGDVSFLITGDVFAEGEAWLVRSGTHLGSDVLKVAHHGSLTSSTAPFLEAVEPRLAVISAGEDNRFGHPHPSIVERLADVVQPGQIYVTSERGSIAFESDGERLWVETER